MKTKKHFNVMAIIAIIALLLASPSTSLAEVIYV
jgi:hypothetical protein